MLEAQEAAELLGGSRRAMHNPWHTDTGRGERGGVCSRPGKNPPEPVKRRLRTGE